MWILGEKDQFTLLKNTMSRGKMNQKDKRKTQDIISSKMDMKHKLQSKYCAQLLAKKERLGLENKYFSIQTHTKPEGILVFCFFVFVFFFNHLCQENL